MSLYAIQSEMSVIINAILDGDADGVEAQGALDAYLADLDSALDLKADGYAGVVQELNLRAESRRAEAARMRELAIADEALADRLKLRLKQAMETTGRLKIDTSRFKLSVANNGGKQPLQVEVEPTSLPSHLQVLEIKANTTAIRAALESGEAVEGCALLPRGTSLRIK